MCVLSINVPIRKKSGNLFNVSCIYIYIYTSFYSSNFVINFHSLYVAWPRIESMSRRNRLQEVMLRRKLLYQFFSTILRTWSVVRFTDFQTFLSGKKSNRRNPRIISPNSMYFCCLVLRLVFPWRRIHITNWSDGPYANFLSSARCETFCFNYNNISLWTRRHRHHFHSTICTAAKRCKHPCSSASNCHTAHIHKGLPDNGASNLFPQLFPNYLTQWLNIFFLYFFFFGFSSLHP